MFTCHRWAHGWDHPHIPTGAHGCTGPGEGVSSGAANTGPKEKHRNDRLLQKKSQTQNDDLEARIMD